MRSDNNNADKKAIRDMRSVQDSINALYAEAERNAKDGAPAGLTLTDLTLADQAPADGKLTADASAEITIPMHLDTSTMDIADASPHQSMETATAHTDKSVACAEQSRTARFEALRMLAEREVGVALVQNSAPAQDDTHLQDDISGRTGKHHSIDSESLRDAAPVTHAAEGFQTALPEQPPAPSALETDKDLNITDIHQLVRQAWEDGDAYIINPVSEKQGQKSPEDDAPSYNSQNTHNQAGKKPTGTDADNPEKQAAADIGLAMENIAAAVKDQQPPEAAPLDIDALKGEIVQAVKNEFRQALRDDLAPVVKNVVTEVMTEMAQERAARERAAKERATKELVARELAAKEQAASTPVVKSTSANTSAGKATKSAVVKTAGTVQAKAAAKKTAKSSAAKSSAAKSSAAKSTGTKTKAKAKARAKKTRRDLDIG